MSSHDARRALLSRRATLAGREDDGARAELEELEAALGRIEAGTWGRCECCEGAIGRDRLRALPETRFCLPCSRR